jgi:hypothetical protein
VAAEGGLTVPDSPLPEFLVTYFEQRQAVRADAVNAFLAKLTDRERALVQDAAVMGYVRGSMHPRGEEIPLNKDILAEVISACFVFPDLYPAVNAHFEDHHQTVEYFVQCQQPDGSWSQCSSTIKEPGRVVEQLAAHRRARPEFEFRIARCTTTVVVEAQQPKDA